MHPSQLSVSIASLCLVLVVVAPCRIVFARKKKKAQEYIDAGLIPDRMAQVMVRTIEAERGNEGVANEHNFGSDVEGEGGAADDRSLAKLNARQLAELLAKREQQMREGGPEGEMTDQWRVYNEMVHSLPAERRLRMMVQAS